jgi:hypothetical protein
VSAARVLLAAAEAAGRCRSVRSAIAAGWSGCHADPGRLGEVFSWWLRAEGVSGGAAGLGELLRGRCQSPAAVADSLLRAAALAAAAAGPRLSVAEILTRAAEAAGRAPGLREAAEAAWSACRADPGQLADVQGAWMAVEAVSPHLPVLIRQLSRRYATPAEVATSLRYAAAHAAAREGRPS